MELLPIATYRSPMREKFGIPKQSGLVPALPGEIVLHAEYSDPAFIRGLDGFDYLWLIWQCHANKHASTAPVVRPPLLGGNAKMGVFATRSPYRPNAIGLSAVRLLSIDSSTPRTGIILHVGGGDLQDGTPIFDIKPYIPYADSHADARAGFVDSHPMPLLEVRVPAAVAERVDAATCAVLRALLALDPRPHYHDEATKVYGMTYDRYNVKFTVADGVCTVVSIDLLV